MSGLSRTAIEWADYGFSPLVGCRNGCTWCYARRLATTRFAHLCPHCAAFEPHLHAERLSQPYARQKPGVVFADPFADPWSEGVEQAWRDELLIACSDHPNLKPAHQFVILTKRPERITEADTRRMRGNLWLGVSITSGAEWGRWETLAALKTNAHKFISMEPLLGEGVGYAIAEEPDRIGGMLPEWCVLGSLSGKDAVPPKEGFQASIRYICREYNIPLFEKDNKRNPLPLQPLIRQMPAELAAVFQKKELLT